MCDFLKAIECDLVYVGHQGSRRLEPPYVTYGHVASVFDCSSIHPLICVFRNNIIRIKENDIVSYGKFASVVSGMPQSLVFLMDIFNILMFACISFGNLGTAVG